MPPIPPPSKRLALALLALIVLFSIDLPAASAQTSKPDPLLAQLEADFLTYWPKLAQFEDDYQRLHGGRYFQALDSASAPPKDGNLETADKLQSSPTDQLEKLDLLWTVASLPVKLPLAFRIDVYEGPSGWGYVVVLVADVKGQIWERQINSGPEKWRDLDWQEVKAEAP